MFLENDSEQNSNNNFIMNKFSFRKYDKRLE